MSSTIPFDPSLALGNIVTPEKIKNLKEINETTLPSDVAEDYLNSLITTRRSLDLTIQELINMKVDPSEVQEESKKLGEQIADAAKKYAKEKLKAEMKILPLKAKIRTINDSLESPIDYNKSQIKKMPLSSDSLKMNVQYFSMNDNNQSSDTQANAIKSFVSGEVEYLGNSFKSQLSKSVQSQLHSQYSAHKLAGTLVISITCTHKEAALLAPFVIDVDKAIRVWNKIHKDDKIKTDSISNVAKISKEANTDDEKSITLLSGATYGSSFIGMVHVLNTTKTSASEQLYSVASSLQAQFEVGGWFAEASGGFGVDSSFSQSAKNLLSSQTINSHASIITMGSIPSIKSNQVQLAVKSFTNDDGEKSLTALAKLQNATAADHDTVNNSANAARTGSQFVALQSSKIESALSSLSEIDNGNNKIIDINSMMDALEDYVNKCLEGNVGVPINFYLKPITRSQLAQLWISKYYPGKYLSISGDDSPTNSPTNSSPQENTEENTEAPES